MSTRYDVSVSIPGVGSFALAGGPRRRRPGRRGRVDATLPVAAHVRRNIHLFIEGEKGLVGESMLYGTPTPRMQRALARDRRLAGSSFSWVMFHRLWVAKKHRGSGVGTQLLNQTCDLADRLFVGLILRVDPHDGPRRRGDLVRLYRRHGFYTLGRTDLMTREPLAIIR